MKLVIGAMAIAGLMVSCSSKPVDNTAEVAAAAKRKIASEMKVLSDQYADARIYFCSEQMAMVSIDPNKCGQARAKNPQAPCTEMPQYFSRALKVVPKGTGFELFDETKKAAEFTVRAKRDSFQVYSAGRKENFLMKPHALTEDEITGLQYMPICK